MTVTVGLLYPGHSAEDDFPALESRVDGAVRLPVVITSVGEDAHRVDALLDLGGAERLADGAAQLAAEKPDAVMWACTSGSFVFGPEGARDQASGVAAVAGVPASSTSIAFVDAAKHLGVQRVAVAASYPEDVAQHFVRFLRAGGIEVVAIGSHGIITAAELGTLEPEQVVAMVTAADHPDAEAVLVPDTAMHTLGIVSELEAAVGKPVLTANQVTVWKGLQLLGPVPDLPGLGALFGERQ
jgi:maleate cis-trans isomerase